MIFENFRITYGKRFDPTLKRLNFVDFMKRFIFLFSLTLLVLTNYTEAFAQKCPRGFKDCKGLCGWFIDMDHDGYCDLTAFSDGFLLKKQHIADSLAAIEAQKEKNRQDSIANANKKNEIKNNNYTNKINPVQKDEPKENVTIQKDTTAVIPIIDSASKQGVTTASQNSFTKKTYDLILIFGGCLVLYLLTFFLSRRDIIKKSTHRKIWNVLLLLTFLATGLLGLFLVVQSNYNLFFDWFSILLYYHVEFGIAMAAISIFHLLWHLKYWLNLFKKAGKNK
jgi:hypothetical protein